MRASDLELEIEAVVSYLMWVLAVKLGCYKSNPGPLARAADTLKSLSHLSASLPAF